MGLSANILWHQTNFDGLKAILESKRFVCSYSLETIKWKSSSIKRAFPMISFCDLPIIDMLDYLGKYGKYIIGINKKWGNINGISPVWYQESQSSALVNIMKFHKSLKSLDNDFGTILWNALSNTKNYEGELIKYSFKHYRFYDEREVRYVPPLNILREHNVEAVLTEEEYKQYKLIQKGLSGKEVALIPQIYLEFKYSDISFILISNENQKNKVKELLGAHADKIVILSFQKIKNDVLGISHNVQIEDEEDQKKGKKKHKNVSKGKK